MPHICRITKSPKIGRIVGCSEALELFKAFGTDLPMQRCRNHKLRNVAGHLPEDQHEQAKATLRAAFKLDAKHLWMLKAAPDEPAKDRSLVQQVVAG
jgi:hypothetical protein